MSFIDIFLLEATTFHNLCLLYAIWFCPFMQRFFPIVWKAIALRFL